MESYADPKWLETILLKDSLKMAVNKILSVETESVVAKGDNYTSNINRIIMTVVLGSGKISKKSLIAKMAFQDSRKGNNIKEWGIFKKEIRMYTEIMECIQNLIKEFNLNCEIFWCKCIHTNPYDTLILEDLKGYGYKMAERTNGLTLDQSCIAIQYLAKFHALSVILLERGLIETDEYKYMIFRKEAIDMLQLYHKALFHTLAGLIVNTWEPEWKTYGKFLINIGNNSAAILKDVYDNIGSETLTVLNHGDYWVNNMMFKYDESNRPISFKMFDLQMAYYNSYAFDLHYFLNTSIEINTSKSLLIEKYQKSLSATLLSLNFDPSKIPSVEQIKLELDKKAVFGLIVACTYTQVMKSAPEDAMDLEEIFKSAEEQSGFKINTKQYTNKAYVDFLKSVLPYFKNNKYISK